MKDKVSYLAKMEKFDYDMKKLYKVGSYTFLTQSSFVGDRETFYSQALRLYLPMYVHITFTKHVTGLDIFTMQGFDHRNKESKRNFMKHTNKKGNIYLQVIKRLWDIVSNMYGVNN